MMAEIKARQDKVTDNVRFKIEHRWSVRKQKALLKEVRHHMRSPPADMVAEQVEVHRQIDWPIMERELPSNLGLKPADRKQPRPYSPEERTRDRIKSDIEGYMSIEEQKDLLVRVRAQMKGKSNIEGNDWWTETDLEMIKEELKANLKLETPKQASLYVREGRMMGRHTGLLEDVPLSFHEILLKRCEHYLRTGEDVCGVIAYLKRQICIFKNHDVKLMVRTIKVNFGRSAPAHTGECDVCSAACKILQCNLEYNLLSLEQQNECAAILREAIASGKAHPAFTSVDECKAVLHVLQESIGGVTARRASPQPRDSKDELPSHRTLKSRVSSIQQ